jgi:SulP family sulfate permease
MSSLRAALCGSSRHLVSGPAATVRLARTLAPMIGILELVMGLARLGSLVNFISHSVRVARWGAFRQHRTPHAVS